MTSLIDFALRRKFLSLVGAGLLVLLGLYSLKKLPMDAVPDVTNVQVQVLTQASGLGPLEVERLVTFPVETALSGLPKLKEVRSQSRFGLSAVTAVFQDGTDIYWARQLVQERLLAARQEMAEGLGEPEMAPISTGLGEIYQFEVTGEGYSQMELRSLLEWDIAPRLKSVPGVVEINTFGGDLKTYEVQVDPARLAAYKVPLAALFEALEKNNANAGGGYIEKDQEQYLIRGEGLVKNLADIGDIVLSGGAGAPVCVKDVARVALAPMVKQGVVTRDGRETVAGIVMMLLGAGSQDVVAGVKARLAEIQKSLPPGVRIETFYDRTGLIDRTIKTVAANLTEGALLVVLVLFLLLGDLRSGVIVALTIPFSMLAAFIGMTAAGVSGNLMSLGAIDFGLIVDGAVVMIENVLRRLGGHRRTAPGRTKREDHYQMVREACREMAAPMITGMGIIMIVYVPILTLQDIEGKMFRPMALTVLFALAGALLVSLTVIPVLAGLFLKDVAPHEETPLTRRARLWYEPLLARALARPRLTLGIAGALFALSLALVPFMGAEFIPRLDEGAIAMEARRLASVSLTESVRLEKEIELTLREFPEVDTVVSKTGRAEIATDPQGPEVSDILITLKRPAGGPAPRREDLVRRFDERLKARVPGVVFSYSQPIELRVSELIAGSRSDVAIKVFGEDLAVLRDKAAEIARAVAKVRGAADVKTEQVSGLPVLDISVDRRRIARYGVNAADVLAAVELTGGKTAGEVHEGRRRFDLRLRYAEGVRSDPGRIKKITVAAPGGRLVPLEELADIKIAEGPSQISREDLHRRVTVEANVRGRDLAGFVAEARKAVAAAVKLPAGYYVTWGGQFENLDRAAKRLAVMAPLTLLLVFVLLYTSFGSARDALLVYLNVPLAATGGVAALFLRGLPFSISAGVGFIALSGVAVLNGVILLSHFRKLSAEGRPLDEVVSAGTVEKFRPVLTAALVAGLGFVPMAVSTAAGAEVQRPLATVVIGGLVTATLLTLLVLPPAYKLAAKLRGKTPDEE